VNEDFKCACVDFYQNDVVRLLLGRSFHPGGLELTRRLGEALALGPGDFLLDAACGTGTSAVFLAGVFGCRVLGVDLGAENLEQARRHAADAGLADRVEFRQGDAERLPLEDGACTAVISECSFCLFPDKETAAREMFRVLAAGGRVGLTDMVVDRDRLPEEMKGLLFRAACIADALTADGYRAVLGRAGFTGLTATDHPEALLALAGQIRQRLLLAELAQAVGKLDLKGLDLKRGKVLLHQAEELVRDGVLGYTLITGSKP